jgi:SAM-dependent methyltransferase
VTRCPVGCVGELEPEGRYAPYRVCRACGTASQPPPAIDAYWGQGIVPSSAQMETWAGRGRQWAALVGAEPGRLLDVGCGFGHFVAWAHERGWDAWGLEPDPWARESSVAPGRIVGEMGELDEPFDLITMFDVLEHVPDPVAEAEALRARLRPGGRLLVGCPSFASLRLVWRFLARDQERFLRWVRPHEHVSQFTAEGLRLVLVRAGFDRVEPLRPPLATQSNPVLDTAARRLPRLRPGMYASAHTAR